MVELAGIAGDLQGRTNIEEVLSEAEQGREKYPGACPLPSYQSSNSASIAKPAWKPADKGNILSCNAEQGEERWGMDLGANKQLIRTRRQILKTLKGQLGIIWSLCVGHYSNGRNLRC